METILNVGLSEKSLRGLRRLTGNPRQTADCYRRLVRDFATVVRGAEARPFDALIEQECQKEGLAGARELDSPALDRIVQDSLELTLALTGEPFPQDPTAQLLGAVEAVFRSWDSEKARTYRRLNGINDQLRDRSHSAGDGIRQRRCAIRGPGSPSRAILPPGENRPYLDFLFNVQGEDVVSGRHTVHDAELLPRRLPAVAAELGRVKTVLEDEFHDMQDFEFTVETGRLYLLQTRDGKRTPWAALRIAVDMVREERISPA